MDRQLGLTSYQLGIRSSKPGWTENGTDRTNFFIVQFLQQDLDFYWVLFFKLITEICDPLDAEREAIDRDLFQRISDLTRLDLLFYPSSVIDQYLVTLPSALIRIYLKGDKDMYTRHRHHIFYLFYAN